MGGIAGHGVVAGADRAAPHSHQAPRSPGLDDHVGPGGGQHLLGVGGHRLVDHRLPLGGDTGQQHGRLDLGAGHRGRVLDAAEGATGDLEGRQVPLAHAGKLRPHAAERIGHPVHGPGPQRVVAGEGGGARHRGGQAGQEAHPRTGVAQVHCGRGGMEPFPAAADGNPGPVVAHLGPEGGHGLLRAEHVVAVGEPGDGGGALAQRGQYQGPVGDGLVPGQAQGSGEGDPAGHRPGGVGIPSAGGVDRPAHRVVPTGMLVAR